MVVGKQDIYHLYSPFAAKKYKNNIIK